MKYSDINDIEKATCVSRREMARFGFALLFIIAVMLIVDGMHLVEGHNNLLLVIAAMIGGYMALNIGANDVANYVGSAVLGLLLCRLQHCWRRLSISPSEA